MDITNQIRGNFPKTIDKSKPVFSSIIANDNVPKKDLDDYYNEFMAEEYNKILDLSVTTELKSLFDLIKNEPNIHVTFLCKNQKEVDILKEDSSTNKYKFIIDTENDNYSGFSAFYFKYITKDISRYLYDYKTYYFSTYRLNFDENFNLKESDIVDSILLSRGSVEILDLYNKSYLMGGTI